MTNWWDGLPNERYWCEVTDRTDVGSDLKAPQKNEAGQDYWSYSLIKEVAPGDVVFHYLTPRKAFAGASVAGGPMEERPIIWSPHGTTGRTKTSVREERPGYWRPLYGYSSANPALALTTIEQPSELAWLKNWVKAHRDTDALRLPFQLRTDGLRAGQGYLFKMPADFVEHWTELRELADRLDGRAEDVLAQVSPEQSPPTSPLARFQPKSEADYTAVITGTVQRRTRTHEKLVRIAGEWLQARGLQIASPHPKDLEIISPMSVIIEAKVVRRGDPLRAAREAVGQLHEYRYFIGPRSAALAMLLDAEPSAALIRYMEEHLQVAVFWFVDNYLQGGPMAQKLVLQSVS